MKEDYIGPKKKFDLNRSILDTTNYKKFCEDEAWYYSCRNKSIAKIWTKSAAKLEDKLKELRSYGHD